MALELVNEARKIIQSNEFYNEFIKTVAGGKEYITHRGLVYLMTELDVVEKLENEVISIPCKENDYLAVVKSIITCKDGRIITGLGDADNKNCNKNIAPHKLRLAETRAESRALRKALGITMLTAEEMTSLDGDENLISDAQVNLIVKLMDEKRISNEQSAKQFSMLTGKKSLEYASREDASKFIDWLMELPNE